jgi:phosphotransferase system enzyme I (PtsI)
MLAHRSEIEQTLAQLRQAQHELDARGVAYGRSSWAP